MFSESQLDLFQVLELSAFELYDSFRVMTVDVFYFEFWANRFVPKNYNADMTEQGEIIRAGMYA